jgi:Zn-dependent protease
MEIVIGLVILVFSAVLHEIAHGLVADRLGDPTPRLSGRLTLDPRPHIDPFMSILLPGMLMLSGSPIIFGGAKPVPVDPYNLKEGRKDIALVALAGPMTNILLAVAGSLIIRFVISPLGVHTVPGLEIVAFILLKITSINLSLAIFNLLPLPPLDGSKLFSLLLPEREANAFLSLGRFGTFILIFLLWFPIGGFSLENLVYDLFTFAYRILFP